MMEHNPAKKTAIISADFSESWKGDVFTAVIFVSQPQK
jgi:hypothetical protein